MNEDLTWTIDGIEAEFLGQRQTPTLTRGSETTLEFLFTGTTEREVEAEGASYGVQYSFNYNLTTVETTPLTFEDTYDELIRYLSYQGDAVVRRGTTDRGVPWFRERLPDDSPVDSLVVPIETSGDVIGARDMWAIVVGGEDLSTPPGNYRSVELELFVLAPLEEYDDRDAVYNGLGDHRE